MFKQRTRTLAEATQRKYEQRYQQLERRFCRETQLEEMSPQEVAAHLILLKPFLSMGTWRQYKAAAIYVIDTYYPAAENAIEALAAESSAGLNKSSNKTSGRKLKQVPDHAWEIIRTKLWERAKYGYRHAGGLAHVLQATLQTGLRPNEWCFSEITTHNETGRTILRVKNSKHSNGRANGEFRELFIDELDDADLESVKTALAYCECNTEDEVVKIQKALENELKNTKKSLRERSPATNKAAYAQVTIYSFRHQFIANAKKSLDDAVLIAALVGHNSTRTAFKHYGKRRHGTTQIKVSPTPESVEAVQKITLENYRERIAQRRRYDVSLDF